MGFFRRRLEKQGGADVNPMAARAIPDWFDVDSPGSRYTDRLAMAILTLPGGARPFGVDADTGDPNEVVARLLASEDRAQLSELGEPAAALGAVGRGASGTVTVLSWLADQAASGVIGGLAFATFVRASRQLRDFLGRLKRDDSRVYISRGAAISVAIVDIIDASGERGILDVELAAEPSFLAGQPLSEQNYVGIEPWLVSLVNETRTTRYVALVAPNGDLLSRMQAPLGEQEAIYSQFLGRPHE